MYWELLHCDTFSTFCDFALTSTPANFKVLFTYVLTHLAF